MGKALCWLLLPLLWGVMPLHAQDRYAEVVVEQSRVAVLHEAWLRPAPLQGQDVLDIAFRIPYPLLVFKQQPAGAALPFFAEAELTVALYQGDQRVATQEWKQVAEAETFEATQDRLRDVAGSVTFAVQPGLYHYHVILRDGHSERRLAGVLHPVWVSEEDAAPLLLGEITQAEGVFRGERLLLGHRLAFGKSAWALVPVRQPASSADQAPLQYRLYRLSQRFEQAQKRQTARQRRRAQAAENEEIRQYAKIDSTWQQAERRLVFAQTVAPKDWLQIAPSSWQGTGTTVQVASSATAESRVALLDLRGEQLADGWYVLEVEQGGDVVAHLLPMYWRDRPFSLYDADLALQQLAFVEARDVIRTLRRGDRAANLAAYWAGRDPTPETAFNELMAEYYWRIDEAARRFRTGQVPYPDGLRTDQAKVFIRQGPPASVERVLPDRGGVEEQWRYPDGRAFIFWAANSFEPLTLQNGAR